MAPEAKLFIIFLIGWFIGMILSNCMKNKYYGIRMDKYLKTFVRYFKTASDESLTFQYKRNKKSKEKTFKLEIGKRESYPLTDWSVWINDEHVLTVLAIKEECLTHRYIRHVGQRDAVQKMEVIKAAYKVCKKRLKIHDKKVAKAEALKNSYFN